MSITEKMLQYKVWAVVGASADTKKFGYKILKKLREHGYQVYAVNPGTDEIDGLPCYASLQELPVKPDVIDMVVNPRVSAKVVEEASKLGISNIWFQPGTINETVEGMLKEKGIQYVKDCVLTALG